MKFIKVLEHNGELYKIGDDIEATFDTGITERGTIKEFGTYGFLEEGLKEGIEFGDYTVSFDSIVYMKKIKHKSEEVMNFAVAVLAECTERAGFEGKPITDDEDGIIDCYLRLSDVEESIDKYLNEQTN